MQQSGKIETWSNVYREIAALLYNMARNLKGNPGKLLYRKCIYNQDFLSNNIWINKFKPAFNVTSLDPIHIFSSFNGNNLSDIKRTKRINIFLKLFEVDKEYDQIEFTGCPTPFIIQMLGARNEEMQKQVWDSFIAIYQYRQRGLNDALFRKIRSWYGIDISSFTIFLFWIDAKNFIPLDKNTIGFLESTSRIKRKPRLYQEYKELIPRQNTNLYKDVAKLAYEVIELGVKVRKYPISMRHFISKQEVLSAKKEAFKVIAIKPLKRLKLKYKKALKTAQLYKFYDYFEFLSQNTIRYDSNESLSIYKINDINVELSAIVGKNGSGKSTITELLYLAINNLSCLKFKGEYENLVFEEGLWMEMYFLTDSLYRISYLGKKIRIHRFEKKENIYLRPKAIPLSNFDLANYFYSLAINYSHFALNKKYLGAWIDKLFHKNDGYQVPIVINPFRKDGNIDVNVEEDLAKSRLLYNILEPILEDENNGVQNSLRELTEFKYAHSLKLKINKAKFFNVYESDDILITFEEVEGYNDIILNSINSAFDLNIYRFSNIKKRKEVEDYAKLYIIKKVVAIAVTYQPYKDYFNLETRTFTELEQYIEELYLDDSHITFKLKQAINFLRWNHIKKEGTEFSISVADLSDRISKIIIDSKESEDIKRIHLVPPSFFTTKLLISENGKLSDFQDLSSGEKQRIHVASSLAYHLFNLNSVSTENGYTFYDCINIVFDEIELYFHPDMQRTFISYLLWYLSKIPLDKIRGINFCFVTHSPFILSDIPKCNILFLNNNSKPSLKTFGANIHELLIDGFFMTQTLGEYALKQIKEILDFCKKVENEQESIIKLKNDYELKKPLFYYIINNIGEEYIKKTLENNIKAIEDKFDTKSYNDWYKNILLKELKKLEEDDKN